MSHLLPSNAIFSPSVARIAASTARDWNFVDAWLATKFRAALARPTPAFERTPETLAALLALASLNEAADDARATLADADAAALAALAPPAAGAGAGAGATDDDGDADDQQQQQALRDALVDAVEASLTHDGAAALDALAAVSVATGTATPTPAALGCVIADLHAQVYETEQMTTRVATLQQYISDEALPKAAALAHDLDEDDAFRQPADLARLNLDAQRRIKGAMGRMPELKERVAAAERGLDMADAPSLEAIIAQEAEYIQALAVKKELDTHLTIFQGLPTDVDVARAELDNLRADLLAKTKERDAMFENLVQKETPRQMRR